MAARRFVSLGGLLLFVYLSACAPAQSPGPSGPDQAAASRALLNEILFLPESGGAAFVELKSSGGSVSLTGLYLLNQRGESFPLPEDVNQLAADLFLLILFDGADPAEGNTIHADAAGFVDPESGFVELYAADGTLLDRAAWGAGQAAATNLSRGGIISDIEPGMTIGRFPRSIRPDHLEWTVFTAAQATPGAANPQLGVEVMVPINGAIVNQTSFELSWYPVAGATQYRAQVASDEAFSALIVDETVDTPEVAVELQAGSYFWRVQAIAQGGETAEFSPVQTLTVDLGLSSLHQAAPQAQASLGVPLISQHKDTAMLLLESKNETGAHAWDVDHMVLDRADPADNGNCALASVAMINAFFGGDLSQDRIGFEILNDTLPGPEWDLMYGQGFRPPESDAALKFALEGEVVYRPQPETLDVIWADVQLAIDAGSPIMAAQLPGHMFVITGYYEDTTTRYVMINDPWWGAYAVDLSAVPWKYYWMVSPASIPVMNDPEISMHSDGDGIVDFDETERFGTFPNDEDTDKDDLKDKDDLRSSIYDEQWGYALASLSFLGRDYDNDGVAMELDEDADGGGCFDGMEDFDLDGKYKEPETYNFDEKDDACFWGTDELLLDQMVVYDDGYHHQRVRTFAKFSLRAVEGGTLEGLAQITYFHTGEFSNPECPGTHDIGIRFFQADLKGTFTKMPDGSTFVSFQATPDRGEPYYVNWVTPCAAFIENELWEGWYWGGQGGALVDGVYDRFDDYSDAENEFWQKVHMEQGQGQ